MRISFLNLLALFAGVAMAIALVLSCGKTTSAAAEPRKAVSRSAPRLALVIGNANYATVGRLANPARDARLIADKLKELGFEVTEKTDRDLKGLTDDVDEFAREIRDRGRETVSLFYYAGHGLESDSVNYLVPVNADIKRKSDVPATSLSVKRIADRLASAGNQLNILILDACRDNPFPESVASSGIIGLVPMGAVYGEFIASSTGAGKAALDGEDGHSPYTKALADAISAPGEKLEDVFKSVRRQVRLTTAEAQIPWESTALDRDFYFVPALPPPTAAAQLLAAAKETGNVALFDLLIERFPDSPEVKEATLISTKLRAAEASAPANAASSAALVLARARETRTPQAYDLVASLFPETPAAEEARTAAARLREVIVLDSAGPTYEGRDLVLQIQAQLERLGCLTGDASGAFDAVTIQGLRRATLLSDERYLWYRPTMAALRVLKKIDAANGCARETIVAAPRCLHINAEDFCP
ncbi:MAG TPA: caspase family protein [Bradyrhizobium sp.]